MKPDDDCDITLLQLVPEVLPTHRPDVAALFGRYLPRAGIHCHIVGRGIAGSQSTPGPYTREYHSSANGPRMLRELSYCLLCLRRLATVRRDRVDLVQVRDMVSIGLLAVLAARFWGLPFTYWMSFPMSEDRIERAGRLRRQGRALRAALLFLKGFVERGLLYRVLLPSADHVFVQSDAMRAMLAARGITANRMTAVPMGVDTERVNAAEVEPARPAGWERLPLFAYLGTLDPGRQALTMVEALAIVRLTVPAARLLLIGDTTHAADHERLQKQIATLGEQDAVRITGWLEPAQGWKLARGADVCISYYPRSSILDVGSPTKLLEYLALGMPAIANDNPDQQYVLESSQAGWVCASNARALACAMGEVLQDLPAARRRAASGVDFVRRWRSYAYLADGVARRYRGLRSREPGPGSPLPERTHSSRPGPVTSTQTKSTR